MHRRSSASEGTFGNAEPEGCASMCVRHIRAIRGYPTKRSLPCPSFHLPIRAEVPVRDHVVIGLDPIRRQSSAAQTDFVVLTCIGTSSGIRCTPKGQRKTVVCRIHYRTRVHQLAIGIALRNRSRIYDCKRNPIFLHVRTLCNNISRMIRGATYHEAFWPGPSLYMPPTFR